MQKHKIVLFLLLLSTAWITWSSGTQEGNDHNPFEWAGVFNLRQGNYIVTFRKVKRRYYASPVKLVIVQAATEGTSIYSLNLAFIASLLKQVNLSVPPPGKSL